MKKTIQTNIGGFVFNMDEDAYVATEHYLNALKQHFSADESSEEIMEDIELRIAEIFKDTLKNSREVITQPDVDHMIGIMGQPEMISEEDHAEKKTEKDNPVRPSGNKRLYRDPDNKVFGGVCGGLGAYFGIDPVIFRVLFGVMFIAWGTGVMVYILLWIAMPKAKTTVEKLEMRGERINVSNIEKQVKDEVDGVKKEFNKFRNSPSSTRIGSGVQNFFQALADILLRLVRIGGKVLAGIFIVVGVIILALLFSIVVMGRSSLININGITYHVSTTELMNVFSGNPMISFISIIALCLLIAVPLLMIIYAGIKMLFNLNYKNKWLNISGLILWVCGLILAGYVALNVASEFKQSYSDTIEKEILIGRNQTLVLEAHDDYKQIEDFIGVDENGKPFPVGDIKLNIIRNQDNDSISKLDIMRFSRGRTRDEAGMYAKKIQYDVVQTDTTLIFEPVLLMTYADRFRDQRVQITLKIPEKQKVYIAPGMEAILYDVKNVLNVWDKDMVGYTWIMEKKGLNCINCPSDIINSKNRHQIDEDWD